MEDVNGFMNALHGASTDNGLSLILHTPGGDPNAVESIVEYLHAKFDYIEVIVPFLAMSGGAMMSLASDRLIMGRQSQLGPIDPQFQIGTSHYSARAIHEGFLQAREDIAEDVKLAHLWAPILQNMGPSLFLEAAKSLSYSQQLVENWLKDRDLIRAYDTQRKHEIAGKIASYFNADKTSQDRQIHVHGQRIGPGRLVEFGLNVVQLEEEQALQDDVLTAYHLMTLMFENSTATKFIMSDLKKQWVKHQPQIADR